jgi:predicted nucleic acid-binding protein
MIVVDSSVWISYLRNFDGAAVQKLRNIGDPQDILLGDLMLLEVLQDARDERHAAIIENRLRQFEIQSMLNENLAAEAARNYRRLQEKGITVRKTADLIIGTFCIAGGHALLHADREFDAMHTDLGLTLH